MSEFERTILERLAHLENEVKQLKSVKSIEAVEFERLPDSATVGKDYVAYRFLCSEEAVMRGRAGTHLLKNKRVSDKPLKFVKRDVDAAWREYTKPVPEKAAQMRSNAPAARRRKSLMPKKV